MDIFQTRSQAAVERIDLLRSTLKSTLGSIPASDKHPTLCIYATGSLARHEACEFSDLDAFFLLSGTQKKKPIGRIRDVKILNAVLDASELAKFPDFSNDGQFLKFLHVDDVVNHIGGREDDYANAFTARMLLLLESECLFNQKNYDKFKSKIIDAYFNDFHSHSEKFMPIFLLNDVIRFWRTLCLNYENSRNWRKESDSAMRAKGHLDNLKLKFSRLNICYSFICHLLNQGECLTRAHVESTSKLRPIERLDEIADSNPALRSTIQKMKDEYSWFLDITSNEKSRTLEWISNDSNRKLAFSRAGSFVECTVNVTQAIAENNGYLRYFIV